jgi:hypothetical protein
MLTLVAAGVLTALSLLTGATAATASTTDPVGAVAQKAKPRFPGDRPGRIYLGMSCDDCPKRESQLGRGVGLKRWFGHWGEWSGVAAAIEEDRSKHRRPWISVKGPQGGGAEGWAAVGRGEYDADIRALGKVLKAHDDEPLFLSFGHEVSNNGSAADGRAWARGFKRFHDVLESKHALENVALAPIVVQWLFDDANPQDPASWLRPGVLRRTAFLGIDIYQSPTGRSFVERVPVVADWLADHGYPHMRIGVGETGATDTFGNVSGPRWLNRSLRWSAHHPDEIAAISYFNSTANSDPNVYWPLDESTAKTNVYLKWLARPVYVSRVR